MAGQYWVAGLAIANDYVEKHGGLTMGKQILDLNRMAMTHLATKWCLANDVNDDDMAAFTVVGTGGIMGGQATWFAYKDFKQTKAPEKPKDGDRAVNASTGKPQTPNVAAAPNGAPKPAQGTRPLAPGQPNYAAYG